MSKLGRGRGKPRDVVPESCEEDDDCSSNFSSDESVDGRSRDGSIEGKGTFSIISDNVCYHILINR